MRALASILLLLLATLVGATAPVTAADRCRVTDPTGTPLNIRAAPQGKIVGTVPNGRLVAIESERDDAKGKPWAEIRELQSGKLLGWVFREFVSCF